MRGVQGRSPDLARACRSTRKDGYVQLRVDIAPEVKDAVIRKAGAEGTTVRHQVESALRYWVQGP